MKLLIMFLLICCLHVEGHIIQSRQKTKIELPHPLRDSNSVSGLYPDFPHRQHFE